MTSLLLSLQETLTSSQLPTSTEPVASEPQCAEEEAKISKNPAVDRFVFPTKRWSVTVSCGKKTIFSENHVGKPTTRCLTYTENVWKCMWNKKFPHVFGDILHWTPLYSADRYVMTYQYLTIFLLTCEASSTSWCDGQVSSSFPEDRDL